MISANETDLVTGELMQKQPSKVQNPQGRAQKSRFHFRSFITRRVGSSLTWPPTFSLFRQAGAYLGEDVEEACQFVEDVQLPNSNNGDAGSTISEVPVVKQKQLRPKARVASSSKTPRVTNRRCSSCKVITTPMDISPAMGSSTSAMTQGPDEDSMLSSHEEVHCFQQLQRVPGYYTQQLVRLR
jgi:hypothetical protein